MRVRNLNPLAAPRQATSWERCTLIGWCIGALMLCTLLCGCGRKGVRYPVNPTKAREVLKTVLDSWKAGKSPEDLINGSPTIIVQDLDWSGGYKLKNYEILGDSEEAGSNLTCQVKLTLQSPKGEEVQKTVTYLAGTAPKLSVFRDMFK